MGRIYFLLLSELEERLAGKKLPTITKLSFSKFKKKKKVLFVFINHEFSTWWRPLCSGYILELILFFWTAECSEQELCLARCLSTFHVAAQGIQVLCATSRTNTGVCQSPKLNQTLPQIQLWNAASVTGQCRKLKLCFFNSTSAPQCTQKTLQSLWFFPCFSPLFFLWKASWFSGGWFGFFRVFWGVFF